MPRSKKTFDERKSEQLEIIEQARARYKKLVQEEKDRERKTRTKRLIAIGAEVEHFAGCSITNLDAFKTFLKQAGPYIANTQNPAVPTNSTVTSTSINKNVNTAPSQTVAKAPSSQRVTQVVIPNNPIATGTAAGGIQYKPTTQNA